MSDVVFPLMSSERTDAEGVLATWYSADGETVSEGQLIAEVQMDKVDAEVVAPASGRISLLVEEGAAVTQGTPIARIQ